MELDKIITALQKINENKISKEIILPLLKKMGFLKVEFHGGVDEQGKDIIIWKKDEFKDIKLILAQVKHFQLTNTASDSKSFQTIVNQLTVCFTKELIYTDKTVHLPSEVLLITTFEVSTKTLLTRFSKYPNLKDLNIKIIDGKKLASLLVEFSPEVVKNLLGANYEIKSKLKPEFNNGILLKALGRHNSKDIRSIYTDIDFSLGKISTKLFFSTNLNPKNVFIDLNKAEWKLFEDLCCKINEVFKLNYTSQKSKDIDELNDDVIFSNETIKEIEVLNENIKYENLELENIRNEVEIQTKSKSEIKHEKEFFLEEINDKIRRLYGTTEGDLLKNKEAAIELEEFRKVKYESLTKEEVNLETRISFLNDKIISLKKSILSNQNEIKKIQNNESRKFIKVKINSIELCQEIIKHRNWIEETVFKYNQNKPSVNNLKYFIQRCNSIIEVATLIFDSKNIKYFESLGFDKNNIIRENFDSTRLKLSIEHIIDTGLNISVLGDAGAGKSTSLEMYAWNRIDANKIILLLPLGRVMQKKSNLNFEITSNNLNLEYWLFEYIKEIGINVDFQEFTYLFEKEDVVLLLDGLDEAIKVAPWLPEQIKIFSEKYNNVQIVLSSRMHGNYLEQIPFFNITLLPFTTQQRDEFISKWFEDNPNKSEIIEKIQTHLEKNIAISDIIRNPLLTTTLCVLAEHNLTLPKTEIKLYDERLNLYTGYYDNIKHIMMRSLSTPTNLVKIAQKIAFFLHINNKREENIEVLEQKSFEMMSNFMGKNDVKNALNELIDPCEILIPMTSDGKYGFGHLRYQEHLAARELFNRSIDIMPLLTQNWWHSSLILFSRMNDNIEWLIRMVGNRGVISLPIIDEMVNCRNIVERKNLQSLVEKYKFLEGKGYTSEVIDFNISTDLKLEDFMDLEYDLDEELD